MDEFYFSLKWLLKTRISVQKVLMFFLKHCGGSGGGGGCNVFNCQILSVQ